MILNLSLFKVITEFILSLTLKNKLIKTLGADVVEELLSGGAKLEELSKLVTNLKKLGLSDELISGFAKSFGTGGLDWLRKARGLNLSSNVITNLSKLDDFANKMDEILELIKKSFHSADEVAECIIKHGDKALDAIRKYGDDAVDAIVRHGDDAAEVIGKYGDDAVDGLKQGKTPEEIEKELGGTGGGDTTTGTIWDNITGTADTIPNTEIPATFKIDLDSNIQYVNPETGTNSLWTNSNATEHMGEYVSRFGDESWSIGMRSQAMLESYSASLNDAMIDLVKQDSGRYFVTYGNWELGINTQTGVVYHARMLY